MIKGRKLGHIGLGTNDIEATVQWYLEVLGFEIIGDFKSPAGEPIKFLKRGDIIYEVFQPIGGAAAPGKIDHFCFESHDIEADYEFCKEKGYTFVSSETAYIPQTYTRIEDQDNMKGMSKMLDLFDDNDDIQGVWHNWENEDEYEG